VVALLFFFSGVALSVSASDVDVCFASARPSSLERLAVPERACWELDSVFFVGESASGSGVAGEGRSVGEVCASEGK